MLQKGAFGLGAACFGFDPERGVLVVVSGTSAGGATAPPPPPPPPICGMAAVAVVLLPPSRSYGRSILATFLHESWARTLQVAWSHPMTYCRGAGNNGHS